MSETLRDLVVSLSLNSDNFTRNIKSINKQIQEAESAFRLASAGVENFETTTAGLSSKLSTLQRTFQLQQDAVGQYERALQQASDKLQECYTRQNDYAQRLTDAKDKQQQLKTEVAGAAQAYKHYKNTLGETDSATIAAKANLDAYKGEYRAAVQEVKKLEGQNVALKKSTQNAADAFSAAQTKLNGAKGAVKETAAEINQCNRQLALSRTSWASAGEAIQTSQRSIASIGKQLKTAESSYRLAAAGVKDFDKSAAGLTAKLTLLQEKLGLQQKAVAEYEKALAAAKEQLQAAQQVNDPDKIREATDAVQDVETALNNARAAVKQTQADIASCNRELKTAQSEWTKAGKSLESFGKACDSASKNLSKAGKLLSTTLTTPIVALGAAAIKSSIDFESSFASVRKTVDATEAQFEQLAATSKKMSTEVAAGTDEINEVMVAGGQLGVATEHLSDFTRVMIDLGNSCEDLNAGDAATTIAQFANIMGTSQSQFSNIGSTLVDLGNNFATTEKPIMEMAHRMAGAGKQVGLTEAQVLGFAAALSSVGIEAQMGGSAFSKALIKMEVASATGGDALEDFGRVAGMTAQQFKTLWDNDPAAAFEAFIVGLSKLDEEGESAIAVLDEIGVKEIRLRDTMLRAVNATDLFSRAQDMATSAWRKNTALSEEANKRYATTESKLKNLKNTALLFGQQIGDDLNPTIRSLIDGAEELLQKFLSMDEIGRFLKDHTSARPPFPRGRTAQATTAECWKCATQRIRRVWISPCCCAPARAAHGLPTGCSMRAWQRRFRWPTAAQVRAAQRRRWPTSASSIPHRSPAAARTDRSALCRSDEVTAWAHFRQRPAAAQRLAMRSKETVEALRRAYPVGCAVELEQMDDPQAPPIGTNGKVVYVDDIATIHVAWSTGSSLGVAYGQDRCRRVDHD